jgi:hypothetical protein
MARIKNTLGFARLLKFAMSMICLLRSSLPH